eukprot:TCONS_00068263-protein
MLLTKYRACCGILWIETFTIFAGNKLFIQAAQSIDQCETEILVSVFGTFGLCFMVFAIVLIACFMARKKQTRPLNQYATANQQGSHKMNDIEGRRNKVFEDEKDDDEFPNGGRKRQDSGFIASSNESIVPLPEMYNLGPRRSPSMPNLRLNSNNEQQTNSEGEVFAIEANSVQKNHPKCPKMVSIGLSTDDLDHNMNLKSLMLPRLTETVVLQKKSSNCTGLDFGVGGVYIKDFDKRDIAFKKGELSIGDEVLSINNHSLSGSTHMEAFSLLAKSGLEVKLEIIRGVFADKADNTSLYSADFQMFQSSSDDEELMETHNQKIFSSTSSTNIPKSFSGENLNRLPRVIADADNLSFDGNESIDLARIKRNTSDSYLLKTVSTVHSNNSSQSESGSPKRFIAEQPSDASTRTDLHGNNGTTNTVEVHQELSKILLANPNLFMDFLASVQAKEKPCPRLKRNSNDSCEHCHHSRNTSSERQRQHSRHSSNEQYIGHAHYGSDHRHNRNCSCENPRFLPHNDETNDDSNFSKFHRTNSSDELGSNVNGHSKIYRSQSVESTTNAPIFTIDSYSRHPEQNHVNRPVIDSLPQPPKQPSDVEQKQRLYELLKQKASLEQLIHQHQQQNKSNELVNSSAHPENVVVQRGYNNDYIVPINGSTYPNIAAGYSKQMHRSKDNSPVRRTSPVVFPTQNVPRFVATTSINSTITTTGSEYRHSSSPHLGSPQNSISTTTPVSLQRKPPPDYASIKRNTSDLSGDESTVVVPTTSPQRDPVNIDADFMRKMTQKYSEPRLRKNPPPYYNAVSDGGNPEGVVLRKKTHNSSNRSRPHSYTETGGNVVYDPNIIFNDSMRGNLNPQNTPNLPTEPNTEIDTEKRKHPKRTHSMPAVKQIDLRPQSAQSFLTNNTSNDNLTQIPPQIAPQYQTVNTQQPPPAFTEQLPQYQPPQLSGAQAAPHYIEPAVSAPYLTQATSEETLHTSTGEYQQAPKKLRTRQQRAQDSFNRRKSIDSGTLRKLAEEMYENPALGGEFPILSQLLGESQFTASERRSQALYRHKSTEALFTQF